jgi:hypothetical protein
MIGIIVTLTEMGICLRHDSLHFGDRDHRQERQKSMNITRKRPKLPKKVPMSTQVGVNTSQEEGRKSFARLVTMITNRSNHMPTFTSRLSTNMIGIDVLIALNQKSCGVMTLQLTIRK